MRTTEKTVYTFDELSESAKEKAREWFRQDALYYEWWDCVYDDAAEVAKILGIDLCQTSAQRMNGETIYKPSISFSGFWSYDDGASFTATFKYAPGMVKKIKDYAPQDQELHSLAKRIQAVQAQYFYRLFGSVSESPHYHNLSVSVDYSGDDYRDVSSEDETEYADIMRDFAGWIYYQLEKEYEWQMSDECVDENIRANEYEFSEEGEIC